MVRQMDLFPPGLRFGPQLRGSLIVPSRAEGENLYDASGALRVKVCSQGAELRYQGPKGAEFGVEFESKADGFVSLLGRSKTNQAFEMRRQYTAECGGWVCHFYDHRGDDKFRRSRCVHPSGRQVFYEGPSGKMRLTMVISSAGAFHYFEDLGNTNEVIKLRMWRPDAGSPTTGMLCFFENKCYCPLLTTPMMTRMVGDDGRVRHMDGQPGQERLVKIVWPNGDVDDYEGDRAEERLVRRLSAKGKAYHYVGPKGSECIVRTEGPGPNGSKRIAQFTGAQGREVLVNVILLWDDATCQIGHYGDPPGDERNGRLTRRWHRNGTLEAATSDGTSVVAVHTNNTLRVRTDSDAEWTTHHAAADGKGPALHAEPPAKRQRVKDAARELFDTVEALSGKGHVNEQALVAIGDNLKQLHEVVDS